MKIVSGLGSIDDYEILAKAGADEFFIGYVPYRWAKTYGVISPLNRREVLYYNVQISSLMDLEILKKMVDSYQVPVKITFNSLYYTKEQYQLIEDIMWECIHTGFDTFIIADVALLLYIHQRKIPCKIHLSGETAEINRSMLRLWKDYSITRVIFHRKNTILDMQSCIMDNPKIEYEAFILNELCQYTGAFCNSLHCDELTHLCKVPYEIGQLSKSCKGMEVIRKKEELALMDEMKRETTGYVTGSTGCGLCALKKLKDAGVTHLKLVGRGNYTDYMVQDIKNLKKAMIIADETYDDVTFQERIKKELFQDGCSKRCYYQF